MADVYVHLFPACRSTGGHVPGEVTNHSGERGNIFITLKGYLASYQA